MEDSVMIPVLGPVMLVINIITLFLCLRPKRGTPFTFGVFLAYGAVIHFFVNPFIIGTFAERFGGLIVIPAIVLLFRGQTFQKVFASLMVYQLTMLQSRFANALVGATMGYGNPHAATTFFLLSLSLLGVYAALVLRFGRRLFERLFLDGRRSEWGLYSLGAAASFSLLVTVRWTTMGAGLYFGLLLFILWSFGVLCFTIINTHEKEARTHHANTLSLQMATLREQTDADKKYQEDMEILRHDMRHEMDAIMELFRTDKTKEAEMVYADWKNSLAGALPMTLCAEPVLNAAFSRFERRAKDMGVHLSVSSNVPSTLPVDTIQLSVILSNALENALRATEKVSEQGERHIYVKLMQNGSQIGLEVANPYTEPVAFDDKGLPITHKAGHGVGVRSIAAFAKDNGCLLHFQCLDGIFTMRLVMGATG